MRAAERSNSRGASRAARLALVALLATAAAADEAVNRAVNLGVRGAKRHCGAIGVHVLEVATGRTVYEYNADRRRIPASNTKLFTSAAALDRLGPGYFFETEVLLGGRVDDGVVTGDLAVVGGGDPNISGRHHFGDSFAVFRSWAETLARRGVRRVEGDLVLVHGLFEGPVVHPDWPADQRHKWYEAPVAALSFADNCALVQVWPAKAEGGRARVEVLPRVPYFSVESSARTTASSGQHLIGVERVDGEDRLSVRGAVYRRAGPVETWVAVTDPVRYFGAALRRALAEEGIEIGGTLRPVAALPEGAWERLVVHRSDLLTTLEVINKRSQNFYAESVLKLLGARVCERGSWGAGARAVGEFLERLGIERGTYRMADGSGMSRSNEFTPRQITTLLRHMFDHRYSAEFLRTLPYGGEKGSSWERRLAEPPYRANVLAKTGRLRAVSALSGYAKSTSGRVYAFSVLCNEARSDWGARDAQDEIVRAIVRNG